MYEHMVNWELVRENMAGITPRGIESAHIHIGMPTDTMMVIVGDRDGITLPMPFYSYTLIPVYGF